MIFINILIHILLNFELVKEGKINITNLEVKQILLYKKYQQHLSLFVLIFLGFFQFIFTLGHFFEDKSSF